jgi:uncharacterized protein YecE (DUF72 family)
MAKGRILIGTSGWHYRHWVGPFYPPRLPARERLRFYAERFPSVELNNTFYRLPRAEAVAGWRDGTPEGFVFACKGSRFLTHMKKLKDAGDGIARFFAAIGPLREKLGPILFQLPGGWRVNAERLDEFLKAVPKGHRYAFEFRDETWFTAEVIDLLRRSGAALCAWDFDRRQSPVELTADFAYVRLHGPDGPYRGSYDDRALRGWARRLGAWRDKGIDAYCYFDNDDSGYAAANAARLMQMVGGAGKADPRR